MKGDQLVSASIKSVVLDTVTTFLQDFSDAIAVGDRARAAVAAARVSQMGLSMFEFFGSGADAISLTHEDRIACHEAAIVVRNLMEKNLDKWYADSRTAADKAKLHFN